METGLLISVTNQIQCHDTYKGAPKNKMISLGQEGRKEKYKGAEGGDGELGVSL